MIDPRTDMQDQDDLGAAQQMLDEMGAKPFDYDAPTGLDGSLEALKGFMRPSAAAGRSLMMAGAPVAAGRDSYLSSFSDPATTGFLASQGIQQKQQANPTATQDAYFRDVVEDVGNSAVDYWTPDPVTMSGTAKAINLVGNVAGSVPQMIGTPGLFLASSGLDPATELTRQGVDANTAMGVGAVNLAVNAAGMRLPAAFGSTLATRVATGAGSNLALGVAGDAASAQALSLGGYETQAASYNPTDPYARSLDVLMGIAFGGAAHVGAGRLTRAQADAVLVSRNADHIERTTMPGEPLAPGADIAHQSALTAAMQQVLGGQRVDVAAQINPDDFLLRPELAQVVGGQPALSPVASAPAYTAYRRTLESGGRADAQSATSSAMGIDQFTTGTWLRMVEAERPAWAEGMTQDQILAARADPAKSGEMATALDRQNAAALARAGADATVQNLYAAHHFGADAGVRFAAAAGDTPVDRILSAQQMEANPYLRGKTKDEVVANWNKRAGQVAAEGGQPRRKFEDPGTAERATFDAAVKDLGIPDDIRELIAPRAIRDTVTDFFDARVGDTKMATTERAIAHVEETGEPAHFVSADIANLGGLNDFVGNRADAANVHFRAMAEIAQAELRATGADVVSMRTGGDELGALVINADAATVDAAMSRAMRKVEAYAKREGLADIPHPKRKGEKGVGLHIGRTEIIPGDRPTEIFGRADDHVNASKKGGANVRSDSTGTAGAVARDARRGSADLSGADGAARGEGGAVPRQPDAADAGSRTEPNAGTAALETPVAAATRLAQQDPALTVIDGFDADGAPIYRPLSEALADIEAERQRAVRDADGLVAAVNCSIRRGPDAS